MKKLRIVIIGYLIIATTVIVIPIVMADWPQPPDCLLPMIHNQSFDAQLLGWGINTLFPPFGIPDWTDNPFTSVRMLQGEMVYQPLDLPPGDYEMRIGILLDAMGPIQIGRCPAGTEWGEIVVRLNDRFLFSSDLEGSVVPPYDEYIQVDYSFYLPRQTGGYLTVYWLGGDCVNTAVWLPDPLTIIKIDWISLCKTPDPTWTPTVTGTPPDTPTPTTTPTVFCEATDYPTGTPYPSSTPYPTNMPWLTPPVLLTQTPLPTYTPWPTCVPTATKTPYASPTPFHFGVPLTYTNQFGELRQGMTEFFTSTEGLLGNVSGLLISASVAVSDVTSFGVTNTVTISGTPVTTTDMVTIFVSNMDALRYVFGWFGMFRLLAPGPFWFLLLCLAWTMLVMAIKFVSSFLTTVIWPLARTVWDVVIDIWNSIPFL